MSERNPIYDIAKTIPALDCAEKYTSEKIIRRGARAVCCCPFHNEKTPSCTFYQKTGTFNCFGCHECGDSIQFVSKLFNINKYEASQKICADFGLTVETQNKPSAKAVTKHTKLRELRDTLNRSASFTHAVYCGQIQWCNDQLDELKDKKDELTPEDDDDIEMLLDLRVNAEQLTDAIRENGENENALYKILSRVKDDTLTLYQYLKQWDESNGTSYVKGVTE